jgi:ABC-type multidrug transport system permease subunit
MKIDFRHLRSELFWALCLFLIFFLPVLYLNDWDVLGTLVSIKNLFVNWNTQATEVILQILMMMAVVYAIMYTAGQKLQGDGWIEGGMACTDDE